MARNATRLYIALYTDADVHGRLAEHLRARGFDALAASEVGNTDLDDSQQLEFAVSQGRALLTHNAKDFEPLVRNYWMEGKEHFGVIVSEQLPLGELVRRVLKMLSTVDAVQMKNSFRNLGEFK